MMKYYTFSISVWSCTKIVSFTILPGAKSLGTNNLRKRDKTESHTNKDNELLLYLDFNKMHN
jgi:hypothetical protein